MVFSNGLTFIFSFVWGSRADSIGRLSAMTTPALIGAAVAPAFRSWLWRKCADVRGCFQPSCRGSLA